MFNNIFDKYYNTADENRVVTQITPYNVEIRIKYVIAAVPCSLVPVGGVCVAFTSVCILPTKVMPVAEQQLDPVALIHRQ